MPTMQTRYLRFFLTTLVLSTALATALSLSRLSSSKARNAATITVNTTADDNATNGNCTLREAIEAANTDTAVDACAAGSGTDTMAFAIPGAGPHTINLTSQLPSITAPVIIDGTTQPGASCTTAGGLKIELNGAGTGITGLFITAGGSTVKGLVINRFLAFGLQLVTNGGNTISCNYIGTDVTGTVDLGNAQSGISISNSSNNIIGGTTAGAGNLISGNDNGGVSIGGATTTGNQLFGNYIGTNAAGTAALANGGDGVLLAAANGNTVGGTSAGAGNLISGNNHGIQFSANATGNFVQGNFIGTDVTGTVAIPNFSSGVLMIVGSNNTIGGATAAARNIISGNGLVGIGMSGATANTVQNNYIGTNAAGTTALGNHGAGITISGSNNLLGGVGAGNVIAGNNGNGVVISGASNTVQGNHIGTNAAGTAALGNTANGLFVQNVANNLIGGTAAGAGNLISGNNEEGILLDGAASTGNQIQGNLIGTDVTGTVALANNFSGVLLRASANGNTIGGTASGARNVISGNTGLGILISTNNNTVQGNYVGTNATGTLAVANGLTGIELGNGTTNNLVGGSTVSARNLVSGNLGHGIVVNAADNNTVQNNYVGTDVTGTTALGNQFNGISVAGVNNTIGGIGAGNLVSGNSRGLFFTGTGTTGNQVLGNFIGTDATGTVALASQVGVLLENGANNNQIGGTAAGAGNLISGNAGYGLALGNAPNNTIQGNLIGTNAAGNAALGNGGEGVVLDNSPNNLIGGTAAGARNIISGNGQTGIWLLNCQATAPNIQVLGNYIGTDITGTIDLGNAGNGMTLSNSNNSVIGGATASAGNLVSGNGFNGIQIEGNLATGNQIQGNFIGTNAAGTADLGNSGLGVFLTNDASSNLVGGPTTATRNLISGNDAQGVGIAGSNNTVQNNYIGTDVTGALDLGNQLTAIEINNSANNQIGGVGAGNLLVGNGLRIFGTAATGNQVQGNYIGLNAAGTAALGNNNGLAIYDGAGNNLIGGTASGAGNVIVGSPGNDIVGIGGGGAPGNQLRGNRIGTNAAGTAVLGSATHGIVIADAVNTIIGGTAAGARNLIAGCGQNGIWILGSSTTGTQVLGNYIGTDSTGTLDLGNGGFGVEIEHAANNVIGGTTAGAGNLISGNNSWGIQIEGTTAIGNLVQGNFIGTNATGSGALPNSIGGVLIVEGANNNSIGGVAAGASNRIAFNNGFGVAITSAGTGNAVLTNSIFGNSSQGLDLNGDGITANDADDGDMGPNNLQNFPVLQTITTPGTVSGSFDSSAVNSAYPVRLDFYANTACDPSGNGEGEVYLGAISLTGPTALFSFNFTPVPGKQFITATATDVNGNTSEFSRCTAPNQPPTITPTSNITITRGASPSFNVNLLANVIDPDSPNETLTYKINNATSATVNGVTVTLTTLAPPLNTFFYGAIGADCNATPASFTLSVTDSVGNTASGTLNVAVNPNTPPTTFSYNTPPAVGTGGSAPVTLASPPTDNGTFSYAVQSVTGTATFTGSLTVNTAGVVSVSNANPAGTYTVTIRTTDNCGATADAAFTLTVQQRTLTVNSTVDVVANDGACTLREAILNANNNNQSGSTDCAAGSGREVIAFNIPGAGPHTITPTSALPTITGPVVIDGTTQSGASCTTAGGLKIELNGASAGSASGLVITAGNSLIRGLVVNRFALSGIALSTLGSNTIACNYVGTSVSGTVNLGNSGSGVSIFAAPNNTIGGTAADARNVISGNNTSGITISQASATGNVVQGNFIGTDVTGTADLGNNAIGVQVSSPNNLIGGTATGAGNVISGNNSQGVSITPALATGNVVQGNYIGTDVSGTVNVGNSSSGVNISAAPNNTIGGTAAGARNIISGNNTGITISSATAIGNVVQGNYIGTDASGATDLGNTLSGVSISVAPNNTIGGIAAGARNIISGNQRGILISGGTASGNHVEGNYIGTDVNGAVDLGNDFEGVLITNAPNNVIGGTAAGARNVISGNNGGGVSLGSAGNRVEGNYIGTNATGTGALGNDQIGIAIGSPNNTVGGISVGAGNLIAYNLGFGVAVGGGPTAVLGNSIFANSNNPNFANSGLGLDLYTCVGPTCTFGITPNDAADTDTGPNNFQNFPVLNPISTVGTVTGTLDTAAANATYPIRLEFYANTTCDSTGNGEGEQFLGALTLADAAAANNFSFTYTPVGGKTFITATATDTAGNTSEFSACQTECQTITLPTLPNGTVGQPYNQTVAASPSGYTYNYTLSGALPTGLSFNNGVLSGTPVQTGSFTFTITASTSGGACSGSRTYSNVQFTCPALSVNPPTLAQAQAGIAYSQNLTQTGGSGAATYAVTAGALPGGLTLSAAGVLTGTTLQTGGFNFSVTATDSNGCTGVRAYTLNVACPTITLSDLPPAQSGQAYSQTVIAAPSGGAYTFALNSGSLPTGLSLNVSGVLSGTPTQGGTYTFTIKATGFGGACVGTRTYTFSTNCPTINVRPNGLANGIVGAIYNDTLSATPANTTYTFAATTGALPPGLALQANGTLSGTPTAAGNYSFGVTATGFGNCTGTRSYNVLITGTCTPITVNPASLSGGTLGTAYNQTVSVTPAGTYSYAVTNGALPQGLSLDTNTGVLSGTPTQTGTSSFRITATNAGGCSGSRQYVLAIGCATLSFNPPSLPAGRIGIQYNQTITASPGSGYSYNVLVGQLPLGYSLSNAGVLSGVTNQTGTFNFTVRAFAPGGCQGTKAYALTITANAFAVHNDFDGDGRSDLLSWRTTDGNWQIGQSSDGTTLTLSFGVTGDVPVPADYDGDGKADVAVFRPANGTWHILRSSLGQSDQAFIKQWGAATDVPVPGDYDGDGKMDIAVWRGHEGNWYILQSSDGRSRVEAWGTSAAPYNDLPVASDYDGDGQTDLAVFRRGQAPDAEGHWFIKLSRSGKTITRQWGLGSDTPVPADYDGDGQTDMAVWRGQQSNGVWYVWRSADNTFLTKAWGSELPPASDVTAPGDYDGDGKADITVCRNASVWHIVQSSDSTAVIKQLPRP